MNKVQKTITFADIDINEVEESSSDSINNQRFPVNEDADRQRRQTQAYVRFCLPSHIPSVLPPGDGPQLTSARMAHERHRRRSVARSHHTGGSAASGHAHNLAFTATLTQKANAEDMARELANKLCTLEDSSDSSSSSIDGNGQHQPQPVLKKSERTNGVATKEGQRRKSMLVRERLKLVAIPMAQKKAVKQQLSATAEPLVSNIQKKWESSKARVSEFWNQLDFLTSHFKEIEGRFGSATASFFRFTRWLIFLNLFTSVITFLGIVVPFNSSSEPTSFVAVTTAGDEVNGSRFLAQAVRCSATYTNITTFTNPESDEELFLDFFIGTGWMEKTSMFYGKYHNRTLRFAGSSFNYNMGLAYFLCITTSGIVSFLLILAFSSRSVKAAVMSGEQRSAIHYTNSVLCGWDYCIVEEKTANSKKNILYQAFKADILEQTKRLQRQSRTQRQQLTLVVLRVVINLLVLCMLGGSLFLIYFTTNKLLDLRQRTQDRALLLTVQFLPSMTITLLNAIIPGIFNLLAAIEDYWPAHQLKLTLIRTVFVKLSSLGVMTFSLYYTLLWSENRSTFYCAEENKTDIRCCGNFLWRGSQRINDDESATTSSVQCWETFVGQQFYKLAIVDFFALLAVTFFVEFPRKFIFDRLKEKSALVNRFGQQEFDIRKNVLELVYTQTLSWLGTFFTPFLPVMTLIKVVCVFYIKKMSLMRNYAPPQHVYKVARSSSFFNIILLLSFVLVATVLGYMIGRIHPSKSCGPYRLYSREEYVVWTALIDVIQGWPKPVSSVIFFFGTSAFSVPCFFVLCFLIYYYWALGQGSQQVDEFLQEQLRLESRDKQFLLARVNDIIKHGNIVGVPRPSFV